MALCERCNAELEHGSDPLPPEHFDSVQHRVRSAAGWLPLGALPWRLLTILWHRRNRFTATGTLVTLLYDIDEPEAAENCIKVYVARLRTALEASGFGIICRWTVGYRLISDDQLADYPQTGPLEPCDGPQPAYRGKYPFRVMRIGQSFVVTNGDIHTIRAACSVACCRLKLGRFGTRQEAGQVRVTKLHD